MAFRVAVTATGLLLLLQLKQNIHRVFSIATNFILPVCVSCVPCARYTVPSSHFPVPISQFPVPGSFYSPQAQSISSCKRAPSVVKCFKVRFTFFFLPEQFLLLYRRRLFSQIGVEFVCMSGQSNEKASLRVVVRQLVMLTTCFFLFQVSRRTPPCCSSSSWRFTLAGPVKL